MSRSGHFVKLEPRDHRVLGPRHWELHSQAMAGEWQWQGREGGRRWTWMRVLLLLACLVPLAHAFEDAISEREGERRQCAGMYAKSLATGQVDPYIEILFAESAVGQIALAIFPYSLVDLMGSPLSEPLIGRRYICDETAIQDKLCLEAEAGTFIVHRELPGSEKITSQVIKFPSMAPLQYRINSTDYYCVVTSPFVLDSNLAQKTTYDGVIEWHSASGGWLPASEYPKMPFYGALGIVYILLGLGWASQCWLHRRELLQIQWYVLGLFGLLSLEMVADWAYLFHLDKTGPGVLSNVLLGIAAILNAGRTSLSFFSLLVVSLGLGVVKPSLGKVMTRCQVLGVMHFLFGVLYSVGLVTVDVTSSAAFWLLLVICPLSVTMTVFLTWTLAGLNSTIAFLTSKKQMVKVTMYKRLYRILLLAVLVIGAFFVINGMIFSRRLDESFAPEVGWGLGAKWT